MRHRQHSPHVAIACGGTGGHFFPGLAVGEALLRRNSTVTLLVSDKKVDQTVAQSVAGIRSVVLPAVALRRDDLAGYLRGAWSSFRLCLRFFEESDPDAVFTTGGFTGVPAILAAKAMRLGTFIHEANSVPGRANRLLAPWVDRSFAWFPQAASRLSSRCIRSGMPLRSQLQSLDPAASRASLGLDPGAPVLLVMGGSQGASAVNLLVLRALPYFRHRLPQLQVVHLAGPNDEADLRAAYHAVRIRARVYPFLTEIELALGAASVVVSRAGASSLAEFAAVALPPILIPYPAAADNHQFHNARAFVESGAALQLDQGTDTPQTLADSIVQLVEDAARREKMREALRRWHSPNSAEEIAEWILEQIRLEAARRISPLHAVSHRPALLSGNARLP